MDGVSPGYWANLISVDNLEPGQIVEQVDKVAQDHNWGVVQKTLPSKSSYMIAASFWCWAVHQQNDPISQSLG
jgi:hypothetical protein